MMISALHFARWRSLALCLRQAAPRCRSDYFSTNCGLSSSSREARFMTKIMNRHKSKSKMYFFDHVDGPRPSSIFSRTPNQRRMSVLNKMFMKNITEVLATGRTSLSIEGLGIEISKVSITPDFQIVNVLYVSKVNPVPENLNELLIDAAYSLRHEMSRLKLMGEVPRIVFVEDKTLKRLNEVQQLLAEADKGSDDCSEDDSSSGLEQILEEEIEMYNESQRAYGLNHTKIFTKIVTAKRASSVHKRHSDSLTIQEGVQYLVPSSAEIQDTPREKPKHMISQFLREIKAEAKHRSE